MTSSTTLLLYVFTLCAIILVESSSSEENITLTITIPLTSTFTSTESLSEAHDHLKHGKTSPPLKTPLFPRRQGLHTFFLSFGTPPQKLSFVMDTGGGVVEAPCTADYTCTNCSFSAADPKKLPVFFPELSSSSKLLGRGDPRCMGAKFPDVHLGCPRNIKGNSRDCSRACRPYFLQYGGGASSGRFVLENLNFPGKTKIRNFQLGCTMSAARQLTPTGSAGFDRSMWSLPKQMGVKKFAHCLKSHDYDETRESGKLILDYRGGGGGGGKTKGLSLSRAPFLKNPREHPNYYYLGVKGIKIGDKLLRIPSKYLSPGSDGRNGVIIDSGFGGGGYMAKPVFEIATNELDKQLSKYRRSGAAETHIGYSPCYNFTGHKYMKIPDLTYQFTGGANMVVPAENYFLFVRGMSIACLHMITDTEGSLEFTPGPSIILGNSPQVDYYVEYDLKNQRLGFRRQAC